MISIYKFNEQFIKRHDFEYEDFNFLSSKYAHVCFKNIPEAWVCEIDMTISKLKQPDKVVSISQVMGQLVIIYCGTSEFDKNSLNKLNNKTVQLDVDLFKELEAGIILN